MRGVRVAPLTFPRKPEAVLNSQTILEANITSPVGQLIVRICDEHIEELRRAKRLETTRIRLLQRPLNRSPLLRRQQNL